MPTSIEAALKDLFESRGLTLDAGALQGPVQVLDRDSLMDLLRTLVAGAEAEARASSAGGSEISKMLDDYMRQNADLRQKESNARRRAQEAEIQLKLAEAKIKDLEAGGGGGGGAAADASALQPHLAFDPAEGNALFGEIEGMVSGLETTLNDLKDDEGAWAFVSRVAEMRADFSQLHEEYQKAATAFQAAAEPFRSGAAAAARVPELVEAACSARGKISEARLMKKSVEFFRSVIQSE
ncbi:MAG: hypothetical protein MUC63_10625 [Planctomycetes bacterium]|jgi:hypothetical protein|nr:hypothetical protein [Planctomycetota bacterium]